ncbi:hypothetical protein MT349_03000 [Rathayibacter caricis]|uniref:hypothetical protein n=1 Tax=Rathayibacter caricis TaxID=110936 RepID=UPI001FB1B16E|nr:hypothetical protein [Rathayibacter caricis]MCJ1694738.1 hypothetical protein [Rathayibacter caricis]
MTDIERAYMGVIEHAMNIRGAGFSDVTNRNTLMQRRFPGNYVPVFEWLRSTECAAFLGYTLTQADLDEIAAGYFPVGYRRTGDPIHLNELGRDAVTEIVR